MARMTLSYHLGRGLFYGILVSFILALVDVTSKIIHWSFEWFELYLSFVFSFSIIVPLFLVGSVLVSLFSPRIKKKIPKKKFEAFYLASSIAFLVVYYGFIIAHVILITDALFYDPISLLGTALVGVAALLPFVFLYFNPKKIVQAAAWFRKRKMNSFFGNVLFMVIVFVGVSFALDLYLLGSLPYVPSQAEDKPNVIFIVIDTVRPDHLSFNGYEKETTPNLDAFAQQAVVFDRATSASSWTFSSVTSMLTGNYPSTSGFNFVNQFITPDAVTLQELFQEAGYTTALITGDVFTKSKYGLGQGFSTIKDRLDFFEYIHSYDVFSIKRMFHGFFPNLDRIIFRADDERPSNELNEDVLPWISRHKDESFFLMISYYDPHDPFTLDEKYRDVFTDRDLPYRDVQEILDLGRGDYVDPEMLQYITAIYDAELRFQDEQLGRLFDQLEELGLMDETIIVVTADHALELYERGDFGNGRTVYQEVLNVPLLMYIPDKMEQKQISTPVSLIDVHATILDLAGLDQNPDAESISLVPVMEGKPYAREYIVSEIFGSWDKPNNITLQRSILKDNWKLIEVLPEQEQLPNGLYNLATDPDETLNYYDINLKKRDELKAIYQSLPLE